jgi:hypothetical protein
VAGSAFSAVAATASWASVRQSKEDAQERRRPVLFGALQQIHNADPTQPTPTFLNVLNVGGPAKDLTCLFAAGDYYVANGVGTGFLRRQQEARIEAEMPPSSDQRALWICQDVKQRIWSWDLHGNSKSHGISKLGQLPDIKAIWHEFYDEDLARHTRVASTVSISAK